MILVYLEEQDSLPNKTIPSYEVHIPVTAEKESEVQTNNANFYPIQDTDKDRHLYSAASEDISEGIPNVSDDEKYSISEPFVKDNLGDDHDITPAHKQMIDHGDIFEHEKNTENISLSQNIPDNIEFQEVSETFTEHSTTDTEHNLFEEAIQSSRALVETTHALSDILDELGGKAEDKIRVVEVKTWFTDKKSESTQSQSNHTNAIDKKSLNMPKDSDCQSLERHRSIESPRDNTKIRPQV